ncbi:DUF3099 domain-containing protein [Paramicrobacterium fandaimingii]|uniref:DUF3099 domain-containing protein n=1 Tax=Paramicrobacterium fandaimingii TaxID=2708079 RepID=UPI001420A36A|nr:DUF3099 domain-containing protein [Microbacterium fandaimingii]
MKKATITSLGMTPEQERHRRVVKYSVAMGIRMVCVVLMLFAHGWWLLVCAIGAIALPYFAVVIANTPVRTRASVETPGGVVVVRPTDESDEPLRGQHGNGQNREAS